MGFEVQVCSQKNIPKPENQRATCWGSACVANAAPTKASGLPCQLLGQLCTARALRVYCGRTACTAVHRLLLESKVYDDLPRAPKMHQNTKTQFIIVVIFSGGICTRPYPMTPVYTRS